jgi:hypothetical protein
MSPSSAELELQLCWQPYNITSRLFVEMGGWVGSHYFLCLGWPPTMILSIFTYQVAGISGVCHCAWLGIRVYYILIYTGMDKWEVFLGGHKS